MSTAALRVAPRTALAEAIHVSRYDRGPHLSRGEAAAAEELARRYRRGPRSRVWTPEITEALARLIRPLDDVSSIATPPGIHGLSLRRSFVVAMHETNESYWGWNEEQWQAAVRSCPHDMRRTAIAVGYSIGGQQSLHRRFPKLNRRRLVGALFGDAAVEDSANRVLGVLREWGCALPNPAAHPVAPLVYELMLECGSARLEDFTADHVAAALDRAQSYRDRSAVKRLALILRSLGISTFRAHETDVEWLQRSAGARHGVPALWCEWAERWFLTSTLTRRSRHSIFYILMKAGRWLEATHPDCTSPSTWTRATAVSWVASVDRMLVGEWAHAPSTVRYRERVGNVLQPRTKDSHINAMRTFFRDCYDWEWTARRFDPARTLRTPRSVMALIGPDPRVIGDAPWGKLLWAGLNLDADDLRRSDGPRPSPWYPLELVRAVALLWLLSGLRVNEIVRLRVGCIRWQLRDEAGEEAVNADRVCLLDVPVQKTGTAFTKPVDGVVGDAIGMWERLRTSQPHLTDGKTGESVEFLFTHRGMRVSTSYGNRLVIPMLCSKAGVPLTDARGKITSHKARATIASQLYNAKEPMTLFELQAWLGHRSPESTQHYARITPTTLTAAYKDAGYFERNVRAIRVLLDREAVAAGAASAGQPWQHYDLGHRYCSYDYFEQCPHRMACARCDFYIPKTSTAAQLLEAKEGVQRMLLQIPLTDDERAAAEDDQVAIDRLVKRLADVPTPAGPSPTALAQHGISVSLPVVAAPIRPHSTVGKA